MGIDSDPGSTGIIDLADLKMKFWAYQGKLVRS